MVTKCDRCGKDLEQDEFIVAFDKAFSQKRSPDLCRDCLKDFAKVVENFINNPEKKSFAKKLRF